MNEYSEAFKSKMVQRLTSPNAVTAIALSEEVGVPQSTLSRWLRASHGRLEAMTDRQPPPTKTTARVPRRAEDWAPEERLRVVAEAATTPDSELGALLRREGLHEATLKEWRTAALEGLSPERATRAKEKRGSEQKRVRELERELRRKEKALAEAAALLVLQKKVQALWGDEEDDMTPRNDE